MADVRELTLVVRVLDEQLANSKANILAFAKDAGVAEDRVEAINTALIKSTRSTETFKTRADRLRQSVQVLTAQAQRLKDASESATDTAQIIRLNEEYEKTQKVLQSVRAELQKVEEETEGLGDKSRGTASFLSTVGRSLRSAFSSDSLGALLDGSISTALGNIAAGGILGVLDAIVGGFRKVGEFLSFSSERSEVFEQSIANLSAITGTTGDGLDVLAGAAQGFVNQIEGADGQLVTISSSASDAAQSFALLGSAAPALLQNNEALIQITRNAQILATASPELAIEEAINATAGALNNFRLIGEDTNQTVEASTNVINVLAAASQQGAVGIAEVSQTLDVAGGTARNANLTLGETAAAIETIGLNSALRGAPGGTALRAVLVNLQRDAEANNRTFGNFADEIDRVAEANLNVTELTKLFGVEGLNAAQVLIANRQELRRLTGELANAESGLGATGVAFQQAATNANTAENQQRNFSIAVENLGIVVGQTIAPALSALRGFFTRLIQSVTQFIAVDLPGFWDRVVQAGRRVNEIVRAIGQGFLTGLQIAQRYSVAIGLVAVGIAIMNRELIAANVNILRNSIATAANTARQIAAATAQRVVAAATVAYNTVLALLTGQLGLAAIAQRALNFVMSLNPIGLVVTAVGLLTAGFIALYDSSETLRAGISGTFAAFRRIVDNVVGNIVEQFDALGDIIGGLFNLDFNRIADGAARFADAAIRQFTGIGEGVGEAFSEGFNSKISSDIQDALDNLDVTAPDFTETGQEISRRIGEALANGNITSDQAQQFQRQLSSILASQAPARIPTILDTPPPLPDLGGATGGESGATGEGEGDNPTITPTVDTDEASDQVERFKDRVEDLQIEARIQLAGGEDTAEGIEILRREALEELQGSDEFKALGAEYQQALIDGVNEEFDQKLTSVLQSQAETAREEAAGVVAALGDGIVDGRDRLTEEIVTLRQQLDRSLIDLFSEGAPSVEAIVQFKALTGLDLSDIEGQGAQIEAAQRAIDRTIRAQQETLLNNLVEQSDIQLQQIEQNIERLQRLEFSASDEEAVGIRAQIEAQRELEGEITQVRREATSERNRLTIEGIQDSADAQREANEADQQGFEDNLSAFADITNQTQELSDAYFAARLAGVEEGSAAERRILREQFFFNRAISVAEAGINTAKAVTEVLGSPAAPVLVPLIIATGAAQVAAILSTEPPALFKGTDDISALVDKRRDSIPASSPGKKGKDSIAASFRDRPVRLHENERVLDARTNKHFSDEDFAVIKGRKLRPGLIAALGRAPQKFIRELQATKSQSVYREREVSPMLVEVGSEAMSLSLSQSSVKHFRAGSEQTTFVSNQTPQIDEARFAQQVADKMYEMQWRDSSVDKKQLDAAVYGNLRLEKQIKALIEKIDSQK